MAIELSKIVQQMEPSATLAMSGRAKELKASGETVYNLSVGEPDFNTPEHICQAAIDAMRAGHTRYTVASGIPELKKAVVANYKKTHGLEYPFTSCVVSNGAKHAIHNSLFCTLNPGDEVIIPAPYWVSYAELVKLSGAIPVIVQTKEANNFKITPEEFKAAITPKTRMFLLCTPSNPTGNIYSGEELGRLADIVLENNIFVLADEIYENLVYGDNKFVSFPTVREGLQDRVIVINGVSKTYAMTGWRVGWALAPENVAKKMGALQSQETSNPCSVSQYAALAAIQGDQSCVAKMVAEFAKRRDYVEERIANIKGMTCPKMGGAFYAFVNIKEYLGREYGGKMINTDTEWCLELLSQKKVATVMGSAFGAPGYFRASFATSMENIKEAFDRIEEFVA
ncbi:MAG: pyridoxal phosphate-dependent aminotransferase [Thermoguttaceae bacterium]|nr:pyridoxal phosphate-dependent aminotransferase [Thermoguttaceae bacterium]MBR5414688.1 pyridoxal phosphate-dependent aminotransferase [Thermoguttaceae bacterium]